MFNRPRIIPCMSLQDGNMVKTVQFKNPRYLGDPLNAISIYNTKGVDEMCVLDIAATREDVKPDFALLEQIAAEAFFPLSYGGGISCLCDVETIISIGFDKVILNTEALRNSQLIADAADSIGSQSVVVSIDAKRDFRSISKCWIVDGTQKTSVKPVEMAQKAEQYGAGEILLNSIDNDGMMNGYDTKLVRDITAVTSIPVIACGGAGSLDDMRTVLQECGAHAAAAGSLFSYYGKQKAVLITVPEEGDYEKAGITTRRGC